MSNKLTLHQAYQYSNLSKFKLRTAITKGELTAERERTSRGLEYRIYKKDLDAFLAQKPKHEQLEIRMGKSAMVNEGKSNYLIDQYETRIKELREENDRLHETTRILIEQNKKLTNKILGEEPEKIILKDPDIRINTKNDFGLKALLTLKGSGAKKVNSEVLGKLLKKTWQI
jgi:hypothetical protein